MWLPDLHRGINWVSHKLWRYGRTNWAEKVARSYVRIRPRDPSGWLILTWISGSIYGLEAREETIRRGLKQIPDNLDLRLELVDCLMWQGRAEEGSRELDSIAMEHAKSAAIYMRLASLSMAQGDLVSARDHASAALTTTSVQNDPELMLGIAGILARLPSGRDRSVSLLDEIIESLPGDPRPHVMKAILLEETDAEMARIHLDRGSRHFRSPFSTFEQMVADFRSLFSVEPPGADQA